MNVVATIEAPTAARHRPRIRDIQNAVCRRFKVCHADLLSPNRARWITRPRQIAMYLANSLSGRSLIEIGHYFGRRDHTTVLHATRKVRSLIAEDGDVASAIRALTDELSDACGCPACVGGADRFPLDPPQLHLPIAWPGELALQPAGIAA